MATKTKATREQCDRAVKLKKEGKKMPFICNTTHLNYSQAWGAIAADEAVTKKLIVPEAQRTATKVAQMRNSERLSWGDIMVRFGWHPANPGQFTHGKVRKMYKEASGNTSEGHRIGHGGRFLLGQEGIHLYRGGPNNARQKTGTFIEAGMTRTQILERVGKALDDKLDRLTASGKITRTQAAAKKAAGMQKASDALKTSPVKRPVKKAPVTKKAARVAKKANAGKVAADKAEARLAAANAS